MQLREKERETAVRSHVRRNRMGCGAVIGVGFLLTLFLCTASLAIYVVLPPPPLDILVVGLDARGAEGNISRTDSIMLIGITPRRMNTALLSIPRDLFVEVPGYGLRRINTVNVLGELETAGRGTTLLSTTIESNFGIGIDRAVRLDFQAFQALVDAVGGLQINVPYIVVDTAYPTADGGTQTIRFETGIQHMDGERALIYARTRHSDDDYRRAERQQQVIRALGRRLLNPLNWPAAWTALQQHTETNLSLLDVVRVLPPLFLSANNYEQQVIDRNFIVPQNGYSIPNYAALRPFIDANFD